MLLAVNVIAIERNLHDSAKLYQVVDLSGAQLGVDDIAVFVSGDDLTRLIIALGDRSCAVELDRFVAALYVSIRIDDSDLTLEITSPDAAASVASCDLALSPDDGVVGIADVVLWTSDDADVAPGEVCDLSAMNTAPTPASTSPAELPPACGSSARTIVPPSTPLSLVVCLVSTYLASRAVLRV